MNSTALDTGPEAGEGLYPIRTVSTLTGVQAVTLRAWERRYNLIRPRRTPKGHRLYTRQDIERIRRIVSLLDRGMAISQVGPLLDPVSPIAPPRDEAQGGRWTRYRERMREAVEDFNEDALDAAYNDALSLYPSDVVNTHLVLPCLEELGNRWKDRGTGIAEEHFFSVYLRNKVGARLHHLNSRSRGPRLLLSCLPGEFHEISLLLFALTAVSHGYRVLALGANLPLDQIPGVLARRPCAAVVLSATARLSRNSRFAMELPKLVSELDIPVLVGGAQSECYREDIESGGAIVAGVTHQAALRALGDVLANPG